MIVLNPACFHANGPILILSACGTQRDNRFLQQLAELVQFAVLFVPRSWLRIDSLSRAQNRKTLRKKKVNKNIAEQSARHMELQNIVPDLHFAIPCLRASLNRTTCKVLMERKLKVMKGPGTLFGVIIPLPAHIGIHFTHLAHSTRVRAFVELWAKKHHAVQASVPPPLQALGAHCGRGCAVGPSQRSSSTFSAKRSGYIWSQPMGQLWHTQRPPWQEAGSPQPWVRRRAFPSRRRAFLQR